MQVKDLAGLDRIIDNIKVDLGSDAADQVISALFSDLRDELGEPECQCGECEVCHA